LEAKQKIQEHITSDFKFLSDAVAPYKECREVYKFEMEFVFEDWKAEN
jgi:hypothetical protein